jgi:allophanate hydrolase subunit 1
MMRVRSAGDAGLLLETPLASATNQDGNGAATIAAFITAAALPGVIDVVPGAASVLVIAKPGSWVAADLAARLTTLASAEASAQAGGLTGLGGVPDSDRRVDSANSRAQPQRIDPPLVALQ